MAAEPVDVLVIGGGITGAGIARDAALRGFRTALVDKGDFGGGTSSHSSRLIHGGIRYLEQLDFGLVFEASHERHVLLRIAPHLVRPLPFLFPVYRGARVPGWKLVAGMWLYDLLAAFRNVRLHRWLGRKAVLRLEPGLRERALRGAALYYDAQTDDARLVIATVRSAAQAGALVANYAAATSLVKPDGRARGAALSGGGRPRRPGGRPGGTRGRGPARERRGGAGGRGGRAACPRGRAQRPPPRRCGPAGGGGGSPVDSTLGQALTSPPSQR